jgi:hypothetical protein
MKTQLLRKMILLPILGLCLAGTEALFGGSEINFNIDREAPGAFRFRWNHGAISPRDSVDPAIHVQRYNAHTFVLRQSMAVHWEAPFMYLLFGNDRVILIDSGATADPEEFPIRDMVDKLINRWVYETGRPEPELIVAQVSGDPAHIQGHGQFEGRPNTVFLGLDRTSIIGFTGLGSWPLLETFHERSIISGGSRAAHTATGSIDLGGRALEVIPSPGIHPDSVTFYDPYTRWLITGDVILPGRLWVTRWDVYTETIARLQAFAAQKPIHWVMGSNIEMSYTPGVDYRMGAVHQPTETLLQLDAGIIDRVAAAVEELNGFTGIRIYDDFILMYGVPRGARPFGFPNPVPAAYRGAPTAGLR